jgi:SAM-dependent methyltransferase
VGARDYLKPRIQDWMMKWMDNLREEAVSPAEGDVLEIGFGTGLNLPYYGPRVRSLTGLDPMVTTGVAKIESRIEAAPFPVQRTVLRADEQLPFDDAQFDTIVTTWTLCSIPDVPRALAEMRRVLKPGGQYVFIEHGRSPNATTAKWQDRLNPAWRWMADGCNINRPIERIVAQSGFTLEQTHRFKGKGPSIASYLYRGIARRSPTGG